jgi:hypothetical protein
MMDDVGRYVKYCKTCKRAKAFRNAYAGGLYQLEAPEKPWAHIAVDFVVDLPPSQFDSEGTVYKNILVITDRLTKMRHYIPCDAMDTISIAKYFY